MGTPDYMWPEQWEDMQVDGRADLYALGCTLFFLLVGRAPFGDNKHKSIVSKMKAHVSDPPPDLTATHTDLPPELSTIYKRLIAKDPADRYQTAGEVVQALAGVALPTGAPSPIPQSTENASRLTDPNAPTRALDPAPVGGPPSLPVTTPLNDAAPPRRNHGRFALFGGGLAALLVLGVIIIRIKRPDGSETVITEKNDVKVSVEHVPDDPKTAAPKIQPAAEPAGEKQAADAELLALKLPELPPWQLPPGAPQPAIAPFAVEQAKEHQESWAAYLKQKVVETNPLGMSFVLIPPGDFILTARSNNVPLAEQEMKLRRRVRLTAPYRLGTLEVTYGQFRKFAEATGYRGHLDYRGIDPQHPPQWHQPGFPPDDDAPVTFVSTFDAFAFCQWLGKQDGHTYRLPTEAEWEFALLSGGTVYPGGVASQDDLLEIAGLYRPGVGFESPFPRGGQKRPNAFGLFDMVGNVWELCADGEDGSDPSRLAALDPRSESRTSLHGGEPEQWTPGLRGLYSTDSAGNSSGFRVLQEVPWDYTTEPDRPVAGGGEPADPFTPQLPTWKLPAGVPAPAVAPFSAQKARQHQRRWADYVKQKTFTTNSLGMRLALIPPGECNFALNAGTKPEDPTQPMLPIRVTQPFYLGTTEVTVGQFRKFVEATGYKTEAERNGMGIGLVDTPAYNVTMSPKVTWKTPSPLKLRDDDPVNVVSFADVQAFCDWLSQQEQVKYRPPYDAEWVMACRSGAHRSTGLHVGENGLASHVWIGPPQLQHHPGQPWLPAGSLAANPFGLHDMQGNLHELCTQVVEARSCGTGARPSLHGAGWITYLWLGSNFPDFRRSDYYPTEATAGFRVVQELPAVPGLTPAGTTGATVVGPIVMGRACSTRLGPRALVSRPAPLPGLRGWTIATAGWHAGDMPLVALTPDGKRIAGLGGADAAIRIWNDRFELEQVLLGHEGEPRDLKFSPDGRWLASRETSNEVAPAWVGVWELATGRLAWRVRSDGFNLAWSPDSRQLGIGQTGPYDRTRLQPLVLDVATEQVRGLDEPATGGGNSRLRWAPDGSRLLSLVNYRDYALNPPQSFHRFRFYDARTLEQLSEHPLPLDIEFTACEWSPRGDRLLLAGNGVHFWLWDIAKATLTPGPALEPAGLPFATWAPDGERIVVTAVKGHDSVLWNVENKAVERSIHGYGFPQFVDGGRQLALFDSGSLRRFDTATWEIVHDARCDSRGMFDSSPAALSPDGRRVVCLCAGQLTLWDAIEGQFLRRFANLPKVPHISWSPAGNRIALWQQDVSLIDPETGEVRSALKGHTGDVAALAWSPDGSRLATLSLDETAKLWEVGTGECLHTLKLKGGDGGIAWSPTGKLVATLSQHSLAVWEAETGKLVGGVDPLARDFSSTHPWQFTAPNPLAWGPDEETLYLALKDSGLQQVNWKSGEQTSVAWQPEGAAALLVSPDQKWAVLSDYRQSDLVALDRPDLRRSLGALRPGHWHPDSRRLLGGINNRAPLHAYDTQRLEQLGVLLPSLGGEQFVCIGPEGHYRGSRRVDDHIVYVALHDDGAQRTYTPQAFREKFGWQNDPAQAGLMKFVPGHEVPLPELAPVPSPVPTGKPLHDGLQLDFAGRPAASELPLTAQPIDAGAAVSPRATVAQPAAIPGLRSWSLETAGHRGELSVVAVHPGGGLVATIRLWDRAGRLRRVLLGHGADRFENAILALAWSPDGRWLASSGADRQLRIWDVVEGRLQQVHPLAFTGGQLAWTLDGRKLAVAGAGWCVLEPATGAMTSRSSTENCLALWWAPDAKLLSVLQTDGVVRDFDLETGGLDREQRLAQMERPVAAAVSSDARYAAALQHERLALWDVATGKLLKERTAFLIGDRLAWSPQGHLATLGRLFRTWDAPALQEQIAPVVLDEFQKHPGGWFPDGSVLAVGGFSRVHYLDRQSGAWLGGSPTHGCLTNLNEYRGNTLDLSRDGEFFLTRGSGALQQWHLRSAEPRSKPFPCDGVEYRYSPDAQRIAVIISGDVVRDALTGTPQLQVNDGVGMGVAEWSPDGSQIALVRDSGKVEIRDAQKGEILRELVDDRGPAVSARWSPDGLALAVAGHDRLRVFETETGKVRWSADGKRIAAGDTGGIAIIDLATGTETRIPCRGMFRWIPGTSRLLAASWSLGEVMAYDSTTGRVDGTLLTELPDQQRVCIGRDGHYRGTSDLSEHLVYVALLEDGTQQTFTLADFAAKFGWQNDPDQAVLANPGE